MLKADKIIGSWAFLMGQAAFLIGYVLYQQFAANPFDPFPYIFLNLGLSMEAAFTAPLLLMAQNRAAQQDRELMQSTFKMLKGMERRIIKEINEDD